MPLQLKKEAADAASFLSPDGAVRHEFFHPPPGRSEFCGPLAAVPWHALRQWRHDIHDADANPF